MAASHYEEFIQSLGYDKLSKRVEELFYAWDVTEKQYVMTKDDLDWIKKNLEFDGKLNDAFDQAMDIISHDHDLQEKLSFLQYVYMIGGHPSEWLITKAPEIHHDLMHTFTFQLIVVLSLIPLARNSFEERNIDEEHMLFNVRHLKGYIKLKDESKGIYGINLYGWALYLSSFGLIHLSTLHFMHHVYQDPFVFYREKTTRKVIAFAKANLNVRKDGQFNGVNGIDDLWFKTTFIETDHSVSGYVVNPMGLITNQMIDIDLSQYTCILKPGDMVIDFHIPSKSDYQVEAFKSSLLQAIDFFKQYFKEYDYKAFWCVSWLYSPQLPKLIKNPESRLLSISNQGYILPATPGIESLNTFVFGSDRPDYKTVTPKTSLQKSVIEYVNEKRSINAGCWIYMIDDVEQFGQTPYIEQNDRMIYDHIMK
jgi:hypothetical protein